MELEGNGNAGIWGALLKQLRDKHEGAFERGLGQRAAAPGRGDAGISQDARLGLRLVNLPGYSPDFNAAEAI